MSGTTVLITIVWSHVGDEIKTGRKWPDDVGESKQNRCVASKCQVVGCHEIIRMTDI